jgi:hypothetical protein
MEPHKEKPHEKTGQSKPTQQQTMTETSLQNILLNKEFIDTFTRIIFPSKK